MEQIVKKVKERLARKIYWLPPSQVKLVSNEAKRLKMPNDSVLMRQIISNMFQK